MATFMVEFSVMSAIKGRRAIRSFEERTVPESAIQIILEAATYAPTAINLQPWKFVIITNKNEMKKLSDLAKPALIRALPDVGDESIAGLKQRLSTPQYNVFYNAPLLIIVAGAKSLFAPNDCSMAAQNMMLAAYSLGIGSCWIGSAVPITNEPKLKAELGIPEDHEVYAAVIFGYPKENPKTPQKRAPIVLKRIE
jgi:nitroreductase